MFILNGDDIVSTSRESLEKFIRELYNLAHCAKITIYTEYQKAMTVDTQLWAQGIPVLGNGFGLWIGADTSDDVDGFLPGAAEIAWRMTASALKNAMKDMYQGELIVMGDPTVKPHDRMLMTDLYEEMQGGAWVEAVVHSFNAQTGFTTSIYADCINEIDDRYEQQNNFLSKSACATAAAAYFTPVALNQLLFRKNMKYINNALMSAVVKSGLKTVDFLEDNRLMLTNLFGILKVTNVDKAQTDALVAAIKTVNALESPYVGVGTALKNTKGLRNKISAATKTIFTKEGSVLSSVLLTSFDNVADKLVKLTDLKNASAVAKALKKNANALEDITGSKLIGTLKTASASANAADIENLAKALIKYDNVLGAEIQTVFGGMFNDGFSSSLADLAKSILKSDMSDDIKATARTLHNYSNGKNVIKSADNLKDFANALQGCADVSKDTKLLKRVADSMGDVKNFTKIADTAKDVHKYAPKLKGIVQGIGALSGPAGIVANVLWMVVEMAISATIGAYATEKLERYLQNLQVMRIYPLSKNGKVMTAGVTGSKGLVVGSGTENMQGTWTTFVTDLFGAKKPSNFITGVIQFFFTSDKARAIASKYRTQNNVPDVLDSSYDIAELQAKFDANYNKRVSTLAQNNNLLNLNLNRYDDIAKSSAYFKEYAATSYKDGKGLSNATCTEFIPIKNYAMIKRYIDEGLLILYHDIKSDDKITATFDGTSTDLPVYYEDDKKFNAPILRQDALTMLSLLIGKYIDAAQLKTGLLEEDKIQNNQLQLTSATIVDSNTYDGTGLVFRITSQNLKALETACANLTREVNANKFMINYFESGSERIIAIAIPVAEE